MLLVHKPDDFTPCFTSRVQCVAVDMDHERNLSRLLQKSEWAGQHGKGAGTLNKDSRESRKTDPGEHHISVTAWKVSKLSLLKLPIKHLVKSMWYRESCNKIIVGYSSPPECWTIKETT